MQVILLLALAAPLPARALTICGIYWSKVVPPLKVRQGDEIQVLQDAREYLAAEKRRGARPERWTDAEVSAIRKMEGLVSSDRQRVIDRYLTLVRESDSRIYSKIFELKMIQFRDRLGDVDAIFARIAELVQPFGDWKPGRNQLYKLIQSFLGNTSVMTVSDEEFAKWSAIAMLEGNLSDDPDRFFKRFYQGTATSWNDRMPVIQKMRALARELRETLAPLGPPDRMLFLRANSGNCCRGGCSDCSYYFNEPLTRLGWKLARPLTQLTAWNIPDSLGLYRAIYDLDAFYPSFFKHKADGGLWQEILKTTGLDGSRKKQIRFGQDAKKPN